MSFHRVIPDKSMTEPDGTDWMIQRLHDLGALPSARSHSHELFERLRAAVRSSFNVPWTSISPPMERLLYSIASNRRPAHIVCIGVFCGNTLIWNAGAACGPGKCYEASRIIGVDIKKHSIDIAEENLNKLGVDGRVELRAEDGHSTLDGVDFPIDLLYLDAMGPLPGTTGPATKRIYLSLLQRAYDRMAPGGLVVAHDTLPAWFVKDAGAYLDFVRDTAHFRMSASLEPDDLGLEVSVR